ncbi:MAG: hypothetical protein MUF37_01095 [Methanoregulaceae archaeon]|jgi:hypothetical protein|nr:hypothetical protein [Methanoregulaceae archaeon]
MDPWLDRFLRGFSFRINYPVLRYLVVCGAALTGAVAGAFISGGDITWTLIFAFGFYIIGRLLLWIRYRE